MRRLLALATSGVLALGVAVAPAAAAPLPVASGSHSVSPVTSSPAAAPAPALSDARIRLSPRASGLSKPVFVTNANDGSGRLFIVEQTGRIKVYQAGAVRSTPFLNISSLVSKGYEQGLLGLAFHPDFTINRKIYVNYTDTAGDTVIREYRVSSANPNVVSTGTARQILKIAQPYDNHNGGSVVFGPDGYLYIGMGDGGDAGDPAERAQNVLSRLGKMLRIDIDGTTSTLAYRIPSGNPYVGISGYDEIWQTGLRNPYRFSFDRANGNLWIADVGQGDWEEINRATETANGPGRKINWGWDVMEGRHCHEPSSGCSTSGKTLPLLEYGHASGRCAVTGGYVYRGKAIPLLVGGYVFADFCSGEIWVTSSTASSPASRTLLLNTSYQISGFGESQSGELFVLNLGGTMYAVAKA